jgi:ABC-type lipoprotein export system ATPase subunit
MSSEPVILLEEVLVERGNFRLEIPKLQIRPGERVGIIAPSGQGKSTLLMVLAGLISPTRGHVSVNGVNPAVQPAEWRARNLAWMGAELELPTDLRVHEQVCLAAHLMKQPTPAPDNINAVLSSVGLAGYEQRTMDSLSTGQQQRVALARLLLHPSSLRLADEPTASLDKGWSNTCTNLLLAQHDPITVCFASHDPTLIGRADRIITPEGSAL